MLKKITLLLICLVLSTGLFGCNINKEKIDFDSAKDFAASVMEAIAHTGESKPTFEKGEVYELVTGSVYDGDTFRLHKPGEDEEIKVRSACIDSPESRQEYGEESKEYLISLFDKATGIQFEKTSEDRYGRKVGQLWLQFPNGKWKLTQQLQAKQGLVWAYERYKDNCPNYKQVEKAVAIAQEKKLNIWSLENPVSPEDFRKL